MKKSGKTMLIIKLIVTIFVLSVYTIFLTYFDTVVLSNLAVNQLEDSYTSNSTLEMYKDFKGWSWLFYPLFPAIVFIGDIVYLIKNKKSKGN